MTEILNWAGAVAAIWGAASILTAAGWGIARSCGWRGAVEVPQLDRHGRDVFGIQCEAGEDR